MKKILWMATAGALALALVAAGAAYPPDALVRGVAAGGGAPTAGTGVIADGTLGQPGAVGVSSGSGRVLHSGYWVPLRAGLSAVEIPEAEVLTTELRPNVPNPFNPRTTIAFDLAAASAVRLEIFDVRGRLVRSLVDEVLPAGRHAAVWDGADGGGRPAASGLYFCRLRADDYESVMKMTMIR
ncbi:MAG: hypothetical protein IH621_16530 [Krumholzibacteria bacterium]|nr:hypothetical protein [Candidatus Krumholzibacteria bacterium]